MSTEYRPYPPYPFQPSPGQPQPFGAQGMQAPHQGYYYLVGGPPMAPPHLAPPGHAAYYGLPPAAMGPGAYRAQPSSPLFNFSNERFLKGLLIGAAAAYLLTNESVQRTMIKGAVKAWSFVQGGIEEVKERFLDAEAELYAAQAENEESQAGRDV